MYHVGVHYLPVYDTCYMILNIVLDETIQTLETEAISTLTDCQSGQLELYDNPEVYHKDVENNEDLYGHVINFNYIISLLKLLMRHNYFFK